MRAATLIIGALDCLVGIGIALALFASGSDPATKGLDNAAGVLALVTALATGVPALMLWYLRRAPRAALALAIAFPVALIALVVAAAISLP
jgi:hypothetical protein